MPTHKFRSNFCDIKIGWKKFLRFASTKCIRRARHSFGYSLPLIINIKSGVSESRFRFMTFLWNLEDSRFYFYSVEICELKEQTERNISMFSEFTRVSITMIPHQISNSIASVAVIPASDHDLPNRELS